LKTLEVIVQKCLYGLDLGEKLVKLKLQVIENCTKIAISTYYAGKMTKTCLPINAWGFAGSHYSGYTEKE